MIHNKLSLINLVSGVTLTVGRTRTHSTPCVAVNVDDGTPRDALGDRNARMFGLSQKLGTQELFVAGRR